MQYRDWIGYQDENREQAKKQADAEKKADKIMKIANGTLKAKLSPIRYWLMQTFIAYNEDLLLSVIEVTTKKDQFPIKVSYNNIVSLIPNDQPNKHIRLIEKAYTEDNFLEKPADYTDHKYIKGHKIHITIKDYFINHKFNHIHIDFADFDGTEQETEIPLDAVFKTNSQ